MLVQRLIVRGEGEDRLASRLHWERALGALEDASRRLPSGAIVAVRRLALPGVRPHRARQGCEPDGAWRQAHLAELERLFGAAAHPAREWVPASAEAVIFANEAELLACAARDAARGELGLRWWWRSLGLDDPSAVARRWRASVRDVPRALLALACRGEAVGVCRNWPEPEVWELLRSMRTVFSLEEPGRARPRDGGVATAARSGTPLAAAPADSAARDETASTPPWSRVAPEALRLEGVRAECLGVALVLARSPALARTRQFAAEVATWRRAAERAAAAPAAAPPMAVAVRRTVVESRVPRRAGEPAQMNGATVVAVDGPSPVPALAGAPAAVSLGEPRRSGAGEPDIPDARPSSLALAGAQPGVESHCAGALLLINVALALGYYRDFSVGHARELGMSPWDFVALTGHVLLGEAHDHDPLWRLLDDLAGRPRGTAPGWGMRWPRAWRAPGGWRDNFPEAVVLRWREGHRRLVIEHPAGFVVADLPRPGLLTPQLKREQARLAGLRLRRDPRRASPAVPRGGRERWCLRTAGFLRARLVRALGVSPARAVALGLARPGRIEAHAGRVCVAFSLASLPIEVRRAGLDRDPGWIPAAGHDVRFVYE